MHRDQTPAADYTAVEHAPPRPEQGKTDKHHGNVVDSPLPPPPPNLEPPLDMYGVTIILLIN